MELLLGCGRSRDRRIQTPLSKSAKVEWLELVTLDHNPDVKPDVVFDLSTLGANTVVPGTNDTVLSKLPWVNNTFDEIHAYEVLEHIGQQGDYRTFFAQFTEFWRILKPDGLLCATVPLWSGQWAWGDPSHCRVINKGSLVFLSQKEYEKQQGKTSMTDFRYLWKADFDIVMQQEQGESFAFVLKAVKS